MLSFCFWVHPESEKAMAPHSSTLAWKIHGRRSLVGCSPWGREESDMTRRLPFHFSLSCIGEGNGNSLQCSCLENPRDGGAWWASIYGVTQSQTRLKRLSSSSSRVEMLSHWTCVCLGFLDTSKPHILKCVTIAVTIGTHVRSVWGFQYLHILSTTRFCLSLYLSYLHIKLLHVWLSGFSCPLTTPLIPQNRLCKD